MSSILKKIMNIDCISDLHGHFPELEGGDLLIVAGDFTKQDTDRQNFEFSVWLANQPHRNIIFIAGNHDNFAQKFWRSTVDKTIAYLLDSGTEFEGLKIWGSPWTLTFPGIHPKCKAFTVDTEEELAKKWALIPNDIDILITHSPPYGILDRTWYPNGEPKYCGSSSLRNLSLSNYRKLHVFGHIHECGGQIIDTLGCKFVNASIMNERYEPVNKPIRIII